MVFEKFCITTRTKQWKSEPFLNGRRVRIFCFLLNYLIYNDPLAYADLILNGDPEGYLKNVTGSHGLED